MSHFSAVRLLIPFKADYLLTGADVKELYRIGSSIAPTCRKSDENIGEVMTLSRVMIRGRYGYRKL